MRAGIVAVIGRANAGKSTLVNVLVGEKVSIVSPKPQTTRDRILGVLTEKDYQIVFEDTPGIYKADNALNAVMQKTAERAAKDVDAVLLVVDAHAGLSETDRRLVKKYAGKDIPLVVALSKTDISAERNAHRGGARAQRRESGTRARFRAEGHEREGAEKGARFPPSRKGTDFFAARRFG